MANTGLVRRASAALWAELKAVNSQLFPGLSGYSGYGNYGGFRNWFDLSNWFTGSYQGSNRNFQRELGDPSANSLVMSAIHWAGDRIPEADLQVTAIDEEDNERPIPNHPLVELLRRPNPYYSG